MKVYDRKDFLQLSSGTIFCKGVRWCFDNISIKGYSWDNDFLFVDLCNINSNGTDQWVDRLEDSLTNGTSYFINTNASRDGLFEEQALFLVFEELDLELLIQIMKNSINVLGTRELNKRLDHE